MDSNKSFQDIIDFFNSNVTQKNEHYSQIDDEIISLLNYFKECEKFEAEKSVYEVCNELSYTSLRKLFNKEISAIYVPNFISTSLCKEIFKNIENDLSTNMWENTDMFQGYGLPVNYMYGPTVNECIDYFSQVLPIIRKLRSISGGISPVDKLRLELDEIWPDGSIITNNNPFKRKAFVGLTRLMKPEGLVGNETKKNGLIHIDGPLLCDSQGVTFSSNIYINTPDKGGELCLWDISFTKNNREKLIHLQKLLDKAFDKKYRENIQNLLQQILPSPIVIQPQIGDLIILNSCQPHAVKGFQNGVRLSMQTFIYHENGKPLQLYS